MTETPRRLTFGANADAYERARPDWPADAAAWLVPGAPRLVVELGAGTGKLTRALAAAGRHVVAVEPDERMLAVVSGLGLAGVDAVHGSAEALPLADGTADAVVAGSSIHWFDLERALAEAHRVLRPGGTLAFGWNHRDASDPAMARIDAAIRTGGGSRSSWRGRRWPELVTAAGLFALGRAADLPPRARAAARGARRPSPLLRDDRLAARRRAGRARRARGRDRRGGAEPAPWRASHAAVRRRRVSGATRAERGGGGAAAATAPPGRRPGKRGARRGPYPRPSWPAPARPGHQWFCGDATTRKRGGLRAGRGAFPSP